MIVGGVNVVSATLAVKFQREGHQVDVFAFYEGKNDMPRANYGNVPIHIGTGFKVDEENVRRIHHIITERNIELIINQWGLPYVPTAVLKKACKGTNVKWISYYHNDPLFNGRIQVVEQMLAKEKNAIKKIVLYTKLFLAKTATSWMMRRNYNECWRFMVLSKSYISHFQQFTGLENTTKLTVMTNPVTIDKKGFIYNREKKAKEILFVGRLDPVSKRVSRLIETWAIIEPLCPEWKLTIVGDGPERGTVERLIAQENLKHVSLEGTQSPRLYYERASIMAMTSDFEGLPLVLAEGMTFGVVPVVYGSFAAVYDIIDDNQNGVIVPKTNGSFDVKVMADSLMCIMTDEKKRQRMADSAILRSKDYSIDYIYKKWEMIFNDLENENKEDCLS